MGSKLQVLLGFEEPPLGFVMFLSALKWETETKEGRKRTIPEQQGERKNQREIQTFQKLMGLESSTPNLHSLNSHSTH